MPAFDSSPALLGVGYILGPRIAAYMLGGAVLSWFVVIPGIGFFGTGAADPVFPAETKLIAEMPLTGTDSIYNSYIRYIGAGAVVIGGLISLFKSFPTILSSFWHVVTGIFGAGRRSRDRTQKDFPFILLILIIAGLGGRTDQTLANLSLLTDPALAGCDVRIDDGLEEVVRVGEDTVLQGAPGDVVSLVPLGVPAEGVVTEGLKYPLRRETLHPHTSRGVSNRMETTTATVSVKKGVLLCIHTRSNE